MEQYEKKGYLNSEFRLFHLTDQETKDEGSSRTLSWTWQ